MRTKVKICGITTSKEAEYIKNTQPDFTGMVLFFPKSKRNIELENAKHFISIIGDSVKKVAVTVSPSLENVTDICLAGFDYIQIHGTMLPEVLQASTIPIIRAFNNDNLSEINSLKDNDKIFGFLFDAAEPGSGKSFDWSSMEDLKSKCRNKCIFLAGGLTPDNVQNAIKIAAPDVVDVSSGVENSNGIGKDFSKIDAFISNASS